MAEISIAIFISLFIIGVVVFAAIRKRKNDNYDEMQELARLRGYKYGFITMAAFLGFWMMMDTVQVIDGLPFKLYNNTIIIVIFMTSIMVTIAYDVLHDAYFYVGMKPDYWKKYCLMILAVGAVNLISAILAMRNGEMVNSDGYLILGGSISNFIVAVEFLVPTTIILIKKVFIKDEEEE